MDNYTFQKDVPTYCVTAESFPEGIAAAHQQLQLLLTRNDRRDYFGISWPDENGIIIYKAAAEIMKGESLPGLETFVIENGPYNAFYIYDYAKNPDSIGEAFALLLKQHEVDPHGYCLEWYINAHDVKCLVPLGKEYREFTGLNRE
jgi:hypothetical protein